MTQTPSPRDTPLPGKYISPANVSMPGVDACRFREWGGVMRASRGEAINGTGGVCDALCIRPLGNGVMLGEACAAVLEVVVLCW